MYLLAAIVGVVLPLFCSCAGDETVGSGQSQVQTITAAIADPSAPEQTRTCIDMSDTGNGYLGLLWQPADSIGCMARLVPAMLCFSVKRRAVYHRRTSAE